VVEGELKKRINVFFPLDIPDGNIGMKMALRKNIGAIVDEAKKEFQIELMDLYLNPNYKRIEEWFLKWFGDSS